MELFANNQSQQQGNPQTQQQQSAPQGAPQQQPSSTQPQKPQQSAMSNLLGGEKKPAVDMGKMEEMGSDVKTLATRVRTLEEKYRNLRTSIQMNEKNVLEDNKKKNTEIKDINQQIFQLKKEFSEIKEKMNIIIKELQLTAKHENVEAIERYLNLWNPVSFISQQEIVPVVRRALLQLGIQSKNDIKPVEEANPEKMQQEKPHFEEEGM